MSRGINIVLTGQRHHILVVDDFVDNLVLLQTILEAEGYEVTTVSSGSAALVSIHISPPDLILLDIMMPDMDGYEVTRHIRQNPQLSSIPILLITAHATSSVVQGLDLGANDFIRKPFDFEELLARVRAVLRRRQKVRWREDETRPKDKR